MIDDVAGRVLAALQDQIRARLLANLPAEEVKTTGAYELHAWAYMREFFTGRIDGFGFIDLMAAEIDNQLNRAWREGADFAGVAPNEFTQADKDVIISLVKREQDYLDGVAGEIEGFAAEGNHTDEEFSTRFRNRAHMWALGYDSTVNSAKLHFGDKEKYEWVMGPTEQHCHTGDHGKPGIGCSDLQGMVLFAYEWDQAGVKPQSNYTNCGGWNCECDLKPTTKRRTSGGIGKLMDMMVAAHV